MGAANKLYNGNIAETFWRTATDGGFVRNYGYKYDNLNRLKEANYQKSGQLTNMYNEKLSYDKNGNIMNLSRNGDRDEQYLPIQIDNLEYGYATNSNKPPRWREHLARAYDKTIVHSTTLTSCPFSILIDFSINHSRFTQ